MNLCSYGSRSRLIIALILATVGIVFGCLRTGDPRGPQPIERGHAHDENNSISAHVHFIIPDGYRGVFKLTLVGTASSIPYEENKYVYRIPLTGMLNVPELGVLDHWHTTSAEFKNGVDLRLGDGPPSEPLDKSIAFHHVRRLISADEIIFLIGTEVELDRIYKENDYTLGGIRND